ANVCEPFERLVYRRGLEQLPNAPPSSAHWYVLPGLFATKLKDALFGFVRNGGADVIETSGWTVSIVQVYVVTPLVLPASSTAFTPKVCCPSSSVPVGKPEGQLGTRAPR